MPWLYNVHTGDVEHQNEAEWLADQALNVGGWTGLVDLGIPDNSTQAQAVKAAQAYVKAHGGTTPTTDPSKANQNATQYVESAVPGASDVAGFLSGVTSVNLWLRVGKVAIGGALLIIGLAHMTGMDSTVSKVTRHLPIPL